MIFRRLAQHLKEQSWTAIAIEFVLLIVGVFLGIQVANWNEERHLEASRRAALARLHSESEAAIAYLERRIGIVAGEAELRSEVLRRLSDNHWQGADPAQMTKALDTLQYAPAVAPPRAVYDELISTGLYSEIGDPRLREAVSAYVAQIGWVERQIDYVRARMVARNDGRLFAGERYVFDPVGPRQLRMVYDLPTLSADPAYVANAIQNNVSIIAQVDWTQGLLDKARAMCAEISRIDGQPCNTSEATSP